MNFKLINTLTLIKKFLSFKSIIIVGLAVLNFIKNLKYFNTILGALLFKYGQFKFLTFLKSYNSKAKNKYEIFFNIYNPFYLYKSLHIS